MRRNIDDGRDIVHHSIKEALAKGLRERHRLHAAPARRESAA
jgi:hypothetical protein